ncbi:MAG: hypothetical protein AUK47_28360 [Deltaproteobacteria bacterium CG2_30_63_29]|nr:MAG: hypothetical protein AUK47_28360 [Deltaproteobacteria bacterium CG2_30_63_29]PIW02703.1 MAG: hypothetical protein COW42_00195 [Deltaproteobacteria bacterium CG17_big_fil_post_rev_8_21_14_2_50_63_7]PJB39879.1 MAG: hypothetical protein CO108_16180 [Deltaproteobacteria bacterium CG_4_9_14_3_um_filter_63_12]
MNSSTPVWASFFTDEEYEAFLEEVEAEMIRRDLDFEVEEGVVLVVLPGGSETSFGLLNLAQLCNQLERERWREAVQSHFDSMLVARADSEDLEEQSFEAVRSLLKLRVYPLEYLDYESLELLWKPISEGMIGVLVYDLPMSVATVHPSHVERWGMDLESLFELALLNVQAFDPVETQRLVIEDGTLLDLLIGETFFAATHVLLLDEYFGCGEYGALVSVPNRHLVIHHDIKDLSVVQALRTMSIVARHRFLEGPGSVSPHLYWMVPKGGAGDMLRLPIEQDGEGSWEFTPPERFVEEVLNRLAESSS